MFARPFRKAFEQWWEYYFIKNLYGYSREEMKEIVDYDPSDKFIEQARTKAFTSLPYPDEKDVNNDR